MDDPPTAALPSGDSPAGVSLPPADDQFRRLVDAVRDYAIVALDSDGRIVTWNAGAEHITGHRAEEALGRHLSMFYPPEAIERGWPAHSLAQAAATGRFEDEGWRVRKDGSRFWANVVITAPRDDKGVLDGYSTILRDLTERRRQDEDARESEERFHLMVEAVQDYAIFMLDPSGRVASWNAGAERIKGYRREEIVGQHFSRFYPPEKIAERWPEHELDMARASGRFEDEGWRVRKDGSRFWANVVITAVYDAAGTLRGFAKVTRDLTARTRVEKLEEDGRRINEFLAMLGHELRNPLAPIRNAVAVMGARKVADPTINWARELIERQVGHLSRLVDDLLDVGRITSGKITLRREVVDFAAIVSRAMESTRPLHGQARHTVEADLDRAVRVEGDATRLAQIVLNLLSNAAKYTPEGGHVWVRLTRAGDQAALSVRDDGVGMSADLVPNVFDLFTQGERTLDRSEGGLGIGLTMVHRLVELHGGTVAARSPGPGQGSEFVVRIPLAETRPADSGRESRSEAEPSATPQLRILVVDDNQDAADSMVILLRTWGYEVIKARDGAEALALVSRHRPQVVLLDIGLPGMNGYEVAQQIRAREQTRDIVLVALTGYGQAEDRRQSEAAGFSLHLVKPVQPEALRHALAAFAPRRP
jgi:PAS domain S-box-containing protein